MPALSSADHSVSPPVIEIPREYNAAYDIIERNVRAGRAAKLAYIDNRTRCSYGELSEMVNRCANALLGLGLHMEQRVLLCAHDTIEWPVAFLGSIKAGIVPVAVNTLLTTADYEYMLQDSRARALIVSASLLPAFAPLIGKLPHLRHVIVCADDDDHGSHPRFSELLAAAPGEFDPAPTLADDACFWLYSSGSTGAPKGTVHAQSSLIQTAELYARPILGIHENDVVFSAAKLFFAYGLGNALTFPLSVGATTILMGQRPTPDAVFARLRAHRPSIFYGVPTLYAGLLASPDLPAREAVQGLRLCVSAGETLPQDIGRRWLEHFGVDILDGLGSTEMLHIFLSNRPGDVRYGTSGRPVPGYQVRLVDENGAPVPKGEIGDLQICGPTCALTYWNKLEMSRRTFQGAWVRSGDKYYLDEHDAYVHAGRGDDMLKVSGIYVSPAEVEAALIEHPAVLEAAVVGKQDAAGLVKPLAFVVPAAGHTGGPQLAQQLKEHVKSRLAPYKYPRWIEFLAELPRTATGKIQRFKLRAAATQDSRTS